MQPLLGCVLHACMATLLGLPADAHLLPCSLTMKDLPQMLLVLLNLLLLQTSPYLSLYAFAHACCSHGFAVSFTAGNIKRAFGYHTCTRPLQWS